MTHLLSRLCLPHLRTHLPCRLWTLKILGLSSDVSACAVPVRQASVLPWASFPRTPRDVAVALRLDLPSARRSTDLHARFYCSCSLSSRCALPGAQTKKAGSAIPPCKKDPEVQALAAACCSLRFSLTAMAALPLRSRR